MSRTIIFGVGVFVCGCGGGAWAGFKYLAERDRHDHNGTTMIREVFRSPGQIPLHPPYCLELPVIGGGNEAQGEEL